MKKAILEFKEEAIDFYKFLKKPIAIEPKNQSFNTKAKFFSILFLFKFYGYL